MKRSLLLIAVLCLAACSSEEEAVSGEEGAEPLEIVVGAEEIEEAGEPVEAEESEEPVEEEVAAPEFPLDGYEGRWVDTQEVGAPYLSLVIENIKGNSADLNVMSASAGERNLANAWGEGITFDGNTASFTYDEDGSGAGGEITIEILEESIEVKVVITKEGDPFWRIFEGDYSLVRWDEEAVEVAEEETVTEDAPEMLGNPYEGNPQSDGEYYELAKNITEDLERNLWDMYTVYNFGYGNPGDFELVKPHVIHLTTANFAEEKLKPFVEEFYCECDSIRVPNMNEEKLANAVIEKIDEVTFVVRGDYTVQPEYEDSAVLVQILEFKKEGTYWKLNNWHYE